MNELESSIVRAILDYLRLRGYVCKRNNSGKMFGEHKGKRWAVNIGEPGWPDIIGLTKTGQFFGIEVKTKAGVLSDYQELVLGKIKASGGISFVARSVDDVVAAGI